MPESDSENDNISWTSSSPEIKDKKSKNTRWFPNYINFNVGVSRSVRSKRKSKPSKRKHNVSSCSNESKRSPNTLCTFTVKSSTSPIIGTCSVRKEDYVFNSPVLSKKRRNSESDNDQNTSPIINKGSHKLIKLGKRHLIKSKEKSKCVRQLIELQDNNNPTETKQNKKPTWKFKSLEEQIEIELVNSQECSPIIQTPHSPKKSSGEDACLIESVTSQESSEATISSNCTVVPDSLEQSSEEFQKCSPIRKKKYKPGTLAYRFHRLLRHQKADVAIWKHELYLASTSNYFIPATKDDHLITMLKLVKLSTDFGASVLECVHFDSNEKCLVISDLNSLGDLKLNVGIVIKIIPPFVVTYLNVNKESVKAYINVHKIIRL